MITETQEVREVVVRIMNREMNIQCPKNKVLELQESAACLENKMRGLVGNDATLNIEKIAIVAALNAVRELMEFKRQDRSYLQIVVQRLRELKSKVDAELGAEI